MECCQHVICKRREEQASLSANNKKHLNLWPAGGLSYARPYRRCFRLAASSVTKADFDLHFEFNCKLDVSAETPGNVYLVKSTVQMTCTIGN